MRLDDQANPSSHHLSPPYCQPLQIDQNCTVFHSHMSHTRVDIVITLSLFSWEHLRWRGSGKQRGVREEKSWYGPIFPDTFLLPAPRAFNLVSPDQRPKQLCFHLLTDCLPLAGRYV